MKEAGKKIDLVIDFNIDRSVLLERIEGRRIHKPSGRSYHIKFNPPKVEGKDDVTGEALIQRPDDNAESFNKRYDEYLAKTTPITDHYKKLKTLVTINAD